MTVAKEAAHGQEAAARDGIVRDSDHAGIDVGSRALERATEDRPRDAPARLLRGEGLDAVSRES